MKNPLNHRHLRELKSDFSKYIVIFLLLVMTISLVSGFLVADESMINAYNNSFAKYNIEDGHFSVNYKLNQSSKKEISKHISLYELFYKEIHTSKYHIRIYKNRDKINKVCLMSGKLPKNNNEIAIDRMFAQNNNIKINDTFNNYKVVGLVALSDYSALFEDNSDLMFDANKFTVAIVNDKTFNNINVTPTYNYAYHYHNEVKDENKASEDLLEILNKEIDINTYTPRYLNQAINYTGEDLGSDRVMFMLLLYILITIIAFIFAVSISHTIVKESRVIGTLMASGYTKKELIKHYMVMPLIVIFISCIIGNILGYTYFKNMMAGLYYNSYSLPTYKTIWSINAFIETTLIPALLMFIINLCMLNYKLSYSPLQFIKKDFTKKRAKHLLKLSPKLPFISRYNIRVIFQNKFNYIVLFIGLLFAQILLLFGMGMPNLINNYANNIKDNMLSEYQYILKMPTTKDHQLDNLFNYYKYNKAITTENKSAEKFMSYTLNINNKEDINIYGIQKNSQYINLNINKDKVYISLSFSQKYKLKVNDTITLKEKYENKKYKFKIQGIYNYTGGLCVFMNQKDLNKRLDLDETFFTGYFSKTKINDINEDYIQTVIDYDSLTKVTRQLKTSMGSMMTSVNIIALILFIIIIYLLSKIIIEKNSHSISMLKVLGYSTIEISKIYIISTSIIVILCNLLGIPLAINILTPVFEEMMRSKMSGWLIFDIDTIIYYKVFIYALLTYCFVLILEYKKIKNIQLDLALKDRE